jgi:hypothetical protein
MQYNAIDVVKAWAYQNLGLDSNNKFIVVHRKFGSETPSFYGGFAVKY